MKCAGQIVLVRFPQTNLAPGKLRPALMLAKLPGGYADWLICMVSTQIQHYVSDLDEVIQESDSDFTESGLRSTSLIRVGRLAIIEGNLLLGTIGQIAPERLHRIKARLAKWIESP